MPGLQRRGRSVHIVDFFSSILSDLIARSRSEVLLFSGSGAARPPRVAAGRTVVRLLVEEPSDWALFTTVLDHAILGQGPSFDIYVPSDMPSGLGLLAYAAGIAVFGLHVLWRPWRLSVLRSGSSTSRPSVSPSYCPWGGVLAFRAGLSGTSWAGLVVVLALASFFPSETGWISCPKPVFRVRGLTS